MEKVLVILSSLCNDGVTHVVMNYYRHIDKEKIQFDFLVESCREDIRQEIELYGGKIFVIPNRTSRPIKYMKTLNSICKKGYQIVHIHHNSANLIVMAGLVAKLNNIPNIIGHSHNSSCVIKWQHYLCKPFVNFIVNHRFACSEEAGKWIFGNRKVMIIRNAIDVKKFSFNEMKRETIRAELGIKENEKVIGFVGRLEEQKNPFFVVELAKTIITEFGSGYKFLFLGEGKLRGMLEDKVKKYNISSNVIFMGNVKNVNEYLNVFDFFVFPSFYEGLGMSCIEAQTSGIRCLVSANVPKIVKVTDLIEFKSIESNCLSEWANYIIDNINCKRLGVSNQIEKAGYSISKEAVRLEELYLSMI